MSRAYYNEIDPYAAQWLKNLIAAGHIAPGDVDNRSIEDVRPSDLKGYTQCHFFAGIGVWSYALRNAGWPDDKAVWTGSCPCQPFSAAGKGAGFADERHLWPAFFHLITQCEPSVVFGEQVASKDADAWIDLVQTDLEAVGYAVGAVAFPSAGVGAPHIRDRLYWVADSNNERCPRFDSLLHGNQYGRIKENRIETAGSSKTMRPERFLSARELAKIPYGGKYVDPSRLDHANDPRLEGLGGGHQAESGRLVAAGSVAEADESGGVAHADMPIAEQLARQRPRPGQAPGAGAYSQPDGRGELAQGQPAAGPTNGLWRAADWLLCRDGKWRPVEPGTFPLAHGAPARVGRLRAYGNAINAEAAITFIQTFMDCRP